MGFGAGSFLVVLSRVVFSLPWIFVSITIVSSDNEEVLAERYSKVCSALTFELTWVSESRPDKTMLLAEGPSVSTGCRTERVRFKNSEELTPRAGPISVDTEDGRYMRPESTGGIPSCDTGLLDRGLAPEEGRTLGIMVVLDSIFHVFETEEFL